MICDIILNNFYNNIYKYKQYYTIYQNTYTIHTMKITYGIENNSIDVTSICFTKLKMRGKIIIPFGDPAERAIQKKLLIFFTINQQETSMPASEQSDTKLLKKSIQWITCQTPRESK